MTRLPALLLPALLLAGCQPRAHCDTEPAGAPPPRVEADPRPAAAQRAALGRLAARLHPDATEPRRLRALAVHRQAQPGQFAVCGQVNPAGRMDDPHLPFIALVGFDGAAPRVSELILGASAAEATRSYLALLEYCFDGGGAASPRAQRRPMPPLPDQPQPMPRPLAASQPAGLPPGPPATMPPGAPQPGVPQPGTAQPGSVTVSQRSPANIRATPGGGAEIIRSAPRGATLEVFASVPGGWLQVGQGGVIWGWVHVSLMETP